jgi:hypothetical protein
MNSSRQQQSAIQRVNFGDSDLEDMNIESEIDLLHDQIYAQAGKDIQNTSVRLVPFKHEHTATSGQGARIATQLPLVHSMEGDTHADIMAELDYLTRQLMIDADEIENAGSNQGKSKGRATARHARDHSEGYYASNESNAVFIAPSPVTATSNRSRAYHHPTPPIPLSHASDDAASDYSDIPIMQHMIPPRSAFNFKIDTPKGLSPTTQLIPKQHDDQALPDWLRFDAYANEFWGVSPGIEKDGMVRVAVYLWNVVEGKSGVVGAIDLVVVAEEGD